VEATERGPVDEAVRRIVGGLPVDAVLRAE
jgi:hypothetical protein